MPMRIIEYVSPSRVGTLLQEIERESDREPLLIVPSAGDKRLVRDELALGHGFGEPIPRIMRWKDFYLEALNRVPGEKTSLEQRPIDPPDHWLIVHNLINDTLRQLPGNCPLPPGVRGDAFPAMAGESLQELLREKVEPEDLRRALKCDGCPGDGPCSRLDRPEGWLCLLYRNYRKTLRNQRLFDSAEVETLTEELLREHRGEMSRWLKDRTLILVGLLTLSHSQLALVRQIHDLGSDVILLKPATGLTGFHDSAFQLKELAGTERTGEEPRFPVLEYRGGDTGLEPDFLARNLALWNTARGPFAAGDRTFPGWDALGIWTDESQLAPLTSALRRYGIPFDVQADSTVAASPLWRVVERSWRTFRRGWPFRETAELLSETWLAGKRGDIVTARLPVSGEKDWLESLNETGMEDTARSFGHLARFCRTVEAGQTPLELFHSLLGLARDLKWGPLGADLIEDDWELDDRLSQVNRSVSELEDKTVFMEESSAGASILGQYPLSGETALTFLHFWADAAALPRKPQRHGAVQVFAGKLPVLAHFPVFLVTGASDKAWPGNLRESALLPDSRKEALHGLDNFESGATHLPLLGEQRQLREALLRRLVATGANLTILSRPLQDEKGRPLADSPFTAGLYAGDIPWAVKTEEEPPARQVSQILPGPGEPVFERIEITGQHPWLRPTLDALGKALPCGEGTRLSISSLDTWADCPFRYWAQKQMDLEPKVTALYDTARIGNLVHELLQKALARKIEADGTPSLQILVMDAWEDTARELYPELLSVPALARHRDRLREKTLAAANRLDELEETLSTMRQETRQETWLPQLETEGILFVGRADRVDVLKDGRLLLFDYKLAKSANFPVGGKNPKRQLAAYGAMLREAEKQVAGFAYMGIEDGAFKGLLADGSLARALATDMRKREEKRAGELKAAMDEARDLMDGMARSVRTGHYPPNYGANACRYCEFSSLCRRAETGKGDDDDDA